MKTTNTFRLVIIVIFALCSNYIHSQGVAINKTNASAHSSAMLDISSDNTGLLIPRISISNLSNSTPIDSPVESLLVYNTNITTGKGYYFWTGSEWVRLTVTNDLNFVQGSGNATEVAFWNNSNTLSSNSNLFWDNVNGYLGIGINTPTAPLSVLGNHENYVGIFVNQNTTAYDATGIVGTSNSVAANGIGVSGDGGWVGVMGSSLIEGSGDRIGVLGYANANADSKIGVRGSAEGLGTNYGVYGTASGGSENWAGYFAGDTYIQTNLGLGVISPTAQLHTNGTVRFSNYMNGFLYVDNLGNLGVSTASSLFNAGTGLSWSGSTLNSVWTASGNNIYNNNSGYVGIGTATPTNAKLHVEGSGTYDAVFRLRNIEASGANVFFVASNSAWTFGANKLGIGLGDPSSTNVKMTVQENGNVGIGITTPDYRFTVADTTEGDGENLGASGFFYNGSVADEDMGLVGMCDNVAGKGMGVVGIGARYGVVGTSFLEGTGTRIGVFGNFDNFNAERKHAVVGHASGPGINYGIHGIAYGGSENWAGYFSGNTYIESNLGLGTTSMTAQLHTTGTVRFQNYTNGFLSVNNEGYLSVSPASSLFINGTGLSWDGSTLNSVWTASGNNIYNNNSAYVGIGTATPTNAKLHVEGSGTYDAVFRLRNIEASGANVFFVASNSAWTFGANKLGIGLGDPSSTNVKMTVQENGNVGIGVTSPTYKLDVSGTGHFSDQVTIPVTPTADAHAASKKYVDDQVGAVLPSDNVTGSGTATRVAFWNGTYSLSSSASLYWDNTNIRLGIGTSSPANTFSVGSSSQFQVASNGNIASIRGQSMTWPDANAQGVLYNNGTGTLSWSGNGVCYTLPNTGGSAQWVKLGTLAMAQQGRSAYIRVVSNTGYNATTSQNYEVYIRFKTSNGSSVDANGFAGDATYYVIGENGQFATTGLIKFVANNAGTAATSFDVYMYFGAYTGVSSFYEISCSGGTWTHAGTTASDPGAASSSILIPKQEFNVRSGSLVVESDGDVGIGTSTPSSKLHINAGSARISGSTNTNAETGGMLIYSNTSGLGAGTAKKVERYSKLVMSADGSYQIYDDYAVTLYAYRSGDYYYIRLAPKSGYTGWWDYSQESGGGRVNCSTVGTQYTMSSDWGVNYSGGLEVIINREDNSSAPTYRIRPHLHSSYSSGYVSVIVETYYP